MRTLLAAVAALCLVACKKDAPPAPPVADKPAQAALPKTPTELKDLGDGVLHAVQCGAVVAEWMGDPPVHPAVPAFGTHSLRFKLADGTTKDFQQAGQLEFSDWSFDIFSPDCARVALLQDHFGPFHVVKLDALAAYLDGGGPEAILQKKGEAAKDKEPAAMVHGDLRWLSADRAEFTASCCGGVEAFAVSVATPDKLERTFFAAQAPGGIRRTDDGGWENRP